MNRHIVAAVAWAGLVAVAMGADAASQPASQSAEPVNLAVLTPKAAEGKRPAALLLAAEGPRGAAEHFTPRLLAKGFFVFRPAAGEKLDASRVGALLAAVDRAAEGKPLDARKFLLVADAANGPTALALASLNPQRLSGIVLNSVTPVEKSGESIGLWKPPASVPVWVSVGTRPQDAAGTLTMWRQTADGADANFTLDTRLGEGLEFVEPDDALDAWLEAVAAGKAPPRGPDHQAEGERKLYEPFAAALVKALAETPAAAPGQAVSKRDGPLRIEVRPPTGWVRFERGERKYVAEIEPYAQLYLTPAPGGLLFARALAGRSAKTPQAVLDTYLQHFRDKGYLVLVHKSWQAGETATEIFSVLTPSAGKWHRWLVVAGAKVRPGLNAAPMAMVFDASGEPDAVRMSEAFQCLRESMVASEAPPETKAGK